MIETKIVLELVAEVERLSRLVAELSASTGRFVNLLSYEELDQLADELGVEPFESPVTGVTDGLPYQQAMVEFEKDGHYKLEVIFTAGSEPELVRWRD
jgi:hypothetical protein